jgi:hypothetical protein
VEQLPGALAPQQQPPQRHRIKYKRAIQVLGGLQPAGAWAAYIIPISGAKGDDDELMIWVLLWRSGAILIELSRRSKVRAGILLGATVPLTLAAEVILEHRTSYTGALGYSHWELLRGVGLFAAILSSFFT